jgi:hypothetical protein
MSVNKFFKLLSIEFYDLEDSVNTLILSISERYARHEITDYVMKENSSLLKRELADMVIIHTRIMELESSEFASLKEATDAVIRTIYEFRGIPEVVHSYMEKRVLKVVRYIEEVC